MSDLISSTAVFGGKSPAAAETFGCTPAQDGATGVADAGFRDAGAVSPVLLDSSLPWREISAYRHGVFLSTGVHLDILARGDCVHAVEAPLCAAVAGAAHACTLCRRRWGLATVSASTAVATCPCSLVPELRRLVYCISPLDADGLVLCSSQFSPRPLSTDRHAAVLAALGWHPRSARWSAVEAALAEIPIHDPTRIATALLGIAQFLAASHRSTSHSSPAPRSAEPVWLTIIRKYIERNIGGRITLEAAAAIAGISRFHLSRTFRRWTGHTFYRHVLGERIARAQMLLRDPRWSISDVLAEAGFRSPNQFFLNFKKATGETPQRYRQRVLAGKGVEKTQKFDRLPQYSG
jgi:AraC-like DNA-binding protein